MDPDATMDWVDALTSFFECEDIPKNQRVKISKSKLDQERKNVTEKKRINKNQAWKNRAIMRRRK